MDFVTNQSLVIGYFWFLSLANYRFVCLMVFNTTFNNISVMLWRSVFIGGGNRRTRRKPPTCRKSLTNNPNLDVLGGKAEQI